MKAFVVVLLCSTLLLASALASGPGSLIINFWLDLAVFPFSLAGQTITYCPSDHPLSLSFTAKQPVDNTRETPEENDDKEVKGGAAPTAEGTTNNGDVKDPKDSEKFLFGPLLNVLSSLGGGGGGLGGGLGGLLGGGGHRPHHHHRHSSEEHHYYARPPPHYYGGGYPPYGPPPGYGGYPPYRPPYGGGYY